MILASIDIGSNAARLLINDVQIDKDGKGFYSTIIKLSNQQISTLTIYPNPVKEITTLQITNNTLLNTTAILFDVNGKLLQHILITQSFTNIDLGKYAAGFYVLK